MFTYFSMLFSMKRMLIVESNSLFVWMQATFKMTLHVPSDRVALSNMPIAEETQTSPNMKTVKFEESPRMSTYLVAIVVGELEYIEGHTKDGESGLQLMIHKLKFVFEVFNLWVIFSHSADI